MAWVKMALAAGRAHFTHSINDGALLSDGVQMAMSGRIKVGLWLPFSAEQTVNGRSFTWRARIGLRPLTPLRVIDCYAERHRQHRGSPARSRDSVSRQR